MPEKVAEATTDEVAPLTADEKKKLPKLVDRAQGGDKKAMTELEPLLDRSGLWAYVGNLAHKVQEMWLDTMVRHNRLAHAAYGRRADELRAELLAAGDSPLERLLVDRVVLTWLQVCHADCASANLLGQDSYTFKSAEHAQERQDRANARHLKAVKALASVRRLLVPAVQVNIAKNQIISQGVGATPSEEHQP